MINIASNMFNVLEFGISEGVMLQARGRFQKIERQKLFRISGGGPLESVMKKAECVLKIIRCHKKHARDAFVAAQAGSVQQRSAEFSFSQGGIRRPDRLLAARL